MISRRNNGQYVSKLNRMVVSQRDPPVISEPFKTDEYHRSQQHIKPQFAPQPVLLRGGRAIRFEHRSVHVRECGIGEVYREVKARISLTSGVQAGFVRNKDGPSELLFRRDSFSVDGTDL